MSASIYYFSGTGNSYRIAKSICGGLENAGLINIAKQQSAERNHSNNIIGLVFPLYYFGLPVIVEEFLQRLEIPQSAYVFIIVTRGEPMAGGAKRQLDALFHAKDRTYHYLRYITMGNNFPFHFFNGSKETLKAQRNQKVSQYQIEYLSAAVIRRQGAIIFA